MTFKKGKEKTGGRKKGTVNQFTKFKDALIEAFNAKGIDGAAGLTKWAKKPENLTAFYQLMAKLLPREIEVSGNFNSEGLADRLKAAREYRQAAERKEKIAAARKSLHVVDGGQPKE